MAGRPLRLLPAPPIGGLTEHMCLAIPGQVVELVDPTNQIAKVDVVGVRRNINVSLLAYDNGGAQPGEQLAPYFVLRREYWRYSVGSSQRQLA